VRRIRFTGPSARRYAGEMTHLLVALILLLSMLPAQAAEHAWLVGRWELTHAPDGDPKDWVEFTADGHTVSISPTGRRTPGAYVVTEREVRAVYIFQGREVPITYTIDPGRTKLLLHSPRTRTTSVYDKVQ
jgi:hypothetical protein